MLSSSGSNIAAAWVRAASTFMASSLSLQKSPAGLHARPGRAAAAHRSVLERKALIVPRAGYDNEFERRAGSRAHETRDGVKTRSAAGQKAAHGREEDRHE